MQYLDGMKEGLLLIKARIR